MSNEREDRPERDGQRDDRNRQGARGGPRREGGKPHERRSGGDDRDRYGRRDYRGDSRQGGRGGYRSRDDRDSRPGERRDRTDRGDRSWKPEGDRRRDDRRDGRRDDRDRRGRSFGQGRPGRDSDDRRRDDRRDARPDYRSGRGDGRPGRDFRSGGFNRDDRRGGFNRDDRRERDDRRARYDRDGQRGRFERDDRRPRFDRDDRRGPDVEAEEWVPRPGTAPAADEPETPHLDEGAVPPNLNAELKSLSKETAYIVAAHVMAAGDLIDEDPDLAYRHAEAARRRAGRIPLVREAAAETAYAAGKFDIALREFRALRRMNGGDELVPAMADCERALGRPRDGLSLLEGLDARKLTGVVATEALIVEAGIRADLGQSHEALRLLKNAISHGVGPKTSQARLRYAYADLLLEMGQSDAAREWFLAAGKLDIDVTLDVADRVAELDGIILPDSLVPYEEDDEELADQTAQDDGSGADTASTQDRTPAVAGESPDDQAEQNDTAGTSPADEEVPSQKVEAEEQ